MKKLLLLNVLLIALSTSSILANEKDKNSLVKVTKKHAKRVVAKKTNKEKKEPGLKRAPDVALNSKYTDYARPKRKTVSEVAEEMMFRRDLLDLD